MSDLDDLLDPTWKPRRACKICDGIASLESENRAKIITAMSDPNVQTKRIQLGLMLLGVDAHETTVGTHRREHVTA